MIFCQADARVHPGSLLCEVNHLQTSKQENQIVNVSLGQKFGPYLANFTIFLIYLRVSFLQLLTITDEQKKLFALLGSWKSIFSFFFPMGHVG